MTWTPVKPRRGRYVHATNNLHTTACSRRCEGWICGTDEWKNVSGKDACPTCWHVTTTN